MKLSPTHKDGINQITFGMSGSFVSRQSVGHSSNSNSHHNRTGIIFFMLDSFNRAVADMKNFDTLKKPESLIGPNSEVITLNKLENKQRKRNIH
jgi:hypothetical protein